MRTRSTVERWSAKSSNSAMNCRGIVELEEERDIQLILGRSLRLNLVKSSVLADFGSPDVRTSPESPAGIGEKAIEYQDIRLTRDTADTSYPTLQKYLSHRPSRPSLSIR
jgi:hypothetical protein